MKKILSIFTFYLSSLTALEHSVESYAAIDPTSILERSKIDFNSTISYEMGPTYALLSPRMTVYGNKNFDGNIGIGFRMPLEQKKCTVGAHVFYDYSSQMPHFFHQGGFSAEFLTNRLDVRVNYYLPILGASEPFFDQKEAHHWVESEFLYKFPHFSVGLNPIYNISTGTVSVRPKVTLPFKDIALEAGFHLSSCNHECTSYASLIIPLYKSGKSPVYRASSVKTIPVFFSTLIDEKKNP